MPADAARQHRLNPPWTVAAFGCSLLWSLPCPAADPAPARSPMRAEAIASFSYTGKPDSGPARVDAVRSQNSHRDPLDPGLVVMDPLVVHADRGLAPRQFRAMDFSVQQQKKAAAEPKLPFVKVHDFRLSRKLHFGYVSIFGVPVVAGFSW
jgi:hypothetical protein